MSKKHIIIPVFIPHLGCPHKCHFCNQWEVSNSSKLPAEDDIKAEIESYLSGKSESVEIVELSFFGGSFTGIPIEKQEELLSYVFPYIKSGDIDYLRLSTRPDYIDIEILSMLKKYNVKTIELGIQSFFDDVLVASNRGHFVSHSYSAIELIEENGFDFIIQLMPGLPADTFEKSINSAKIAASLNPSGVRIYPTIVLKGTYLHEMYKSGLYKPLTLDEAIEVSKEMLLVFKNDNIDVIRLGLHPFSSEQILNIAAGPYHPAIGFLVKSRLKRDILDKITDEFFKKNNNKMNIVFNLPFIEKEEYIGHKKENINFLKNKYHIDKISFSFSDIDTPNLNLF
jgi:histone acetyltransferase (RNA polymerase elongator complex component)